MAGETPAMQAALAAGVKTDAAGDQEWPRAVDGIPLIKIQAGASELVPTVQYGNVTVGPVLVTRFVDARTPEEIQVAVKQSQEIVEHAISEDRKTVHDLMRSRVAS